MKKTYTNPEFETVKVQGESFLDLSFDTSNDDDEPNFNGGTEAEIPEDGKVDDGIFQQIKTPNYFRCFFILILLL